MTEIFLEGLEFYARHGVYEEEQNLGNRFQVDLRMEADLSLAATSDQIKDTIDYALVYEIVSSQMQIKTRLLETLGQRILRELVQHFPQIKKAELSISKFNPAISGLCKRVVVTSRWEA
jgi:dihydroneopterin aldolase